MLPSVMLFLAVAGVARPLVDANVVISEGVYSNLVVALHPDTPRFNSEQEALDAIQVFLDEGSAALHGATDERASFGDVTVIIPREWEDLFPNAPPGDQSIESADILIHGVEDTIPNTLQVELCGVPGRQIQVPVNFLKLNEEEEKIYGKTGFILTHEWAHYRYGVQDEHGFSGDNVYGALYGDGSVTSCTEGALPGQWKTNCIGTGLHCKPGTAGCYFCIFTNSTAEEVKASLGYLPALSTGKFCDATTHNSESTSPQNVLCGGRSIREVMDAHPDTMHMEQHSLSSVSIVVKQEPLGRVLLLLDTPPTGGEVLPYDMLLEFLQAPLTKYQHLQVGMMSYRATEEEVELYNIVEFATVTEDTYHTLYDNLPTAATITAVPSLADVLEKVLTIICQHAPGTLLVMPVTNALMAEAKLDDGMGNLLHISRVKPLLLFPEEEPSLDVVGSFLQLSGSRISFSNGTENYAVYDSAREVSAYVDNTFQNDHAIVQKDSFSLQPGGDWEDRVLYQRNVVQHRIAIITSSNPISELELSYERYGMPRDCKLDDLCSYQDGHIFFRESLTQFNSPGESWQLYLKNKGGAAADITVTWSEVNFVGVPQELDVSVWLSDGRGPVAIIGENNVVVLYASVMDGDMQVLSSRIHVYADLHVQWPPAMVTRSFDRLQLLDDGADADIRRDDSVFSYGFGNQSDLLTTGSTITVKAVYVESHSEAGLLRSSPDDVPDLSVPALTKTRAISPSSRKRFPSVGSSDQYQSSGLFSLDPTDQECCGSFVEEPNIALDHRVKGFHLYLWDAFPAVVVERNGTILPTTTVTPATTTTTPKPTTTSTPTTTTTTKTTTVAPPPETTTTPATTTTTPKPTTTSTPTTTTTTTTTVAPPPETTTNTTPATTTTTAKPTTTCTPTTTTTTVVTTTVVTTPCSYPTGP